MRFRLIMAASFILVLVGCTSGDSPNDGSANGYWNSANGFTSIALNEGQEQLKNRLERVSHLT